MAPPLPAVDADAVVDLTRRLVRIPSVPGDGGSEAAVAAEVAAEMERLGWLPSVEEVVPGRPNVWTVVDGGLPGPTLMFEGHTDVVTPGDGWTRDPFGAEVVDGAIFGRGAADMKGGLAAMIHAVAAVAAVPFQGRLLVAALCDEEGMMSGVKHFVERGHAAGVDAVIVCEPEGGEVCTTQKGSIRLRLDLAGRMAHGAMPARGRNPLRAATALVAGLMEIEAGLHLTVGEHPHLGLAHLTPTYLAGGSADQLNVIPAMAALGLDIRTIPGVEHPALLAQIAELARTVTETTGVEITMAVVDDRPSTETDPDHPVVRAVVDAHTVVHGRIPPLGGVPGSTDGTILWRDAGLPVAVYGPGDKWIPHQADEHVKITDLVAASRVYSEAARRFLNR